MSNGFCRDCRWWQKLDSDNWGDCALHTDRDEEFGGISKVELAPLGGLLQTYHDFGCNQHTPKDA